MELAERAAEYVEKALGIPLDYSPETLPLVDHYLTLVPRDQPETIELVAHAAGVYFGEVVRRTLGGEWQARGEPAAWTVLLPHDVTFSPVGFCAEAILRTPHEGYEGGFEVADGDRAAVEDALSLKGEVPEDEFYSLSGRLEVLTYVLDIVAGRRSTRN